MVDDPERNQMDRSQAAMVVPAGEVDTTVRVHSGCASDEQVMPLMSGRE